MCCHISFPILFKFSAKEEAAVLVLPTETPALYVPHLAEEEAAHELPPPAENKGQ